MTYRDLKIEIDKLTEDQLNQDVAVFDGDDETPHMDLCLDVSLQDEYFDGDEPFGNYESVKEYAKSADEPLQEFIDGLTKVPAGTVTLHVNYSLDLRRSES